VNCDQINPTVFQPVRAAVTALSTTTSPRLTGAVLFQCVLGVYFYLLNSGSDVSDIGWLPVLSLVFYILVYSFGKPHSISLTSGIKSGALKFLNTSTTSTCNCTKFCKKYLKNCEGISVFDDRLCGLVVRVLGYRSGGPGSIPGTTRKKLVGLERGPLSIVSATEELLDRKAADPV
jgi:hypothetical protein